MHRVYFDHPEPDDSGLLLITGDEARHALRVKRLAEGAPVELLDGRGSVHGARVESFAKQGRGEWAMRVRIERTERREPLSPAVETVVAAPKGPHLDEMISQLSQVGAASWAPLSCDRSVSEPGDARLDRLRRIGAEASKQCGRAWTLRIEPRTTFERAIAGHPAIVLADPDAAEPYTPTASPDIRLLIGPEGGWSPRELDLARGAGVRIVRFGPHAMRLETAAVVATAVIIDVEHRSGSPGCL